MTFIPFYTDYLWFFLVSFREHFAHLIHFWICANIKVFRANLFQNFQVWMSVVLGSFWSASTEGVTRGGHQRGSPEAITGGGHRRGSSEAVIGGGHRRGSPEGVTGGGHWKHPLRVTCSMLNFNHICLQIRFHSPQFCHENKNKLD